MDKPETKKMNYNTEITRHIDMKDAVVDGKTQKKADTLDGTWIKLNEIQYALEEADQTTIIERRNDSAGCACERFTDPSAGLENLMCEHLIAFEDLKSPPQLTIESTQCRGLREVLISESWYAEDRRLYPPMKEPEVVAELPPVNETKLEPASEEKELDIGVDDEKADEPKTITRKCSYCGHTESGTDRDEVVRSIEEHRKNCSKNPAKKKMLPRDKQKMVAIGDERLIEVDDSGKIIRDSATVEKPPKKMYEHPDGTKFDSSEGLLDYVDSIKEAEELAATKALVTRDTTSEGETWTDSQLEVMRKTVADKATPEEFAYFLNVATCSGLNPFLKEIYFLKTDKGQTSIITSRDGYLTIAKRDPAFTGIQSMDVCETDTFEMSMIANENGTLHQTMTHQIGNFKDRGPIIGAWARGGMRGQEPVIIFAAMGEYDKSKQPLGGKIWKQYPSSMIRKVAESMVLKRIAGISGLVTEAEIGGTELIQIEGGE